MPGGRDEDIGGLDVTMDDPFGVCRFQSSGHLNGDILQEIERHGATVNGVL